MAAAEEEDIRFFQELMRLWACTFGNSHCIGSGRFAKNRHFPGSGRTVASPGSATIREGGARHCARLPTRDLQGKKIQEIIKK